MPPPTRRFRSLWLWPLVGLACFFVAPRVLDSVANGRSVSAAPPVRPEASSLHRQLWVADLHADSLLWNRDLAERHRSGHVDIPRMIEGNVALQAFTIVTKTPWGMNVSRNSGSSDMTTLLFVAERWPWSTYGSLLERALHQARRLQQVAADSNGRFRLIQTRQGLAAYARDRQQDSTLTAGYLGIEGAQALEGELANVERLFDAGVRMMSPSHFFDTEVGGSAHGEDKQGLTPLGREVIREMERLGMLVDLAHASVATIDDVLRVASKPVVFSHTGVRATCDSPRNISDEVLQKTAAQGGLVGIAFFEGATCGTDLGAIVRAIRHAVAMMGAEHVALGSDFDGFVSTPIDAAELPALTDALLQGGLSEPEIRLIMGENVRRLLLRVLP